MYCYFRSFEVQGPLMVTSLPEMHPLEICITFQQNWSWFVDMSSFLIIPLHTFYQHFLENLNDSLTEL